MQLQYYAVFYIEASFFDLEERHAVSKIQTQFKLLMWGFISDLEIWLN